MNEKLFSEHDRAFYSDGYSLSQSVVEKEMTRAAIREATETLYHSMDDFLSSFIKMAQQNNKPAQCRRGCSYCCHQPVYAVNHEFYYLFDYIRKHFSENQIKSLKQKAIEKHQALRKVSSLKKKHFKAPCPLLLDGACSAYEARPMACRIYLSTNLQSCIDEFEHPDKTEGFPDLLEFPLRAGRMLNEGFVAGLKEGGLKAKELTVEAGLLAFWDE